MPTTGNDWITGQRLLEIKWFEIHINLQPERTETEHPRRTQPTFSRLPVL
jgi:hypothetical protein